MIKRSEMLKIPISEFFNDDDYWRIKAMVHDSIEAVKEILLSSGKPVYASSFKHQDTRDFINYLITIIDRELLRDPAVIIDIDAMVIADNTILLCFKHLK